MARRKEPVIPDTILDQLLGGADAKSAFESNGLLDQLKKALAERALNAEMDVHLSGMRPVDFRIVENAMKEGNPHDSDSSSRTNPVDSDGSGEDPKPLRLP